MSALTKVAVTAAAAAWVGGAKAAFAALLALATMGIGGPRRLVYLLRHTLRRDIRAARMMVRLILLVKRAQWQDLSVARMFEKSVRRHPDKVMLRFEDELWTFRKVAEYSDRVANVFADKGFKKGDVVAVFMENRPEFVATWLGLSKIGVLPALINNNHRHASLIHSIDVVQCKGVIFDNILASAIRDVASKLPTVSPDSYFCSGGATDLMECTDLDKAMETAPPFEPVPVGFKDKLMYIYTSGTTGMPKAALIKHSRYIMASGGPNIVIGVRSDDVVYSPLPLYHTVAGMISMAGVMHHGFTMVMRRKFSARAFWSDCVKYDVTAAQYIGELCRYLLATKECPEEKQHKVRLMFGNGLRPQIWREFAKRFGIARIAEYYGSTEGNSQIINSENHEGAVGFISLLVPGILPLGLIKIDEETGKALRDRNGLCIPCQPGEPGEFVGKIVRNDPVRDFHGYTDRSATEKKLLTNVFKHGDLYFRSGDILVMDDTGWLYFKDRTGDTFRWKGENVSTAEVEATISSHVDLADVVVYGVKIPDTDGRAGMAAIHDPLRQLDLASLAKAMQKNLPSFAQPLFLRLVTSGLEATGTFKLKKFTLQREGFDPEVTEPAGDDVYFLDPATLTYQPLSGDVFRSINNGQIRL